VLKAMARVGCAARGIVSDLIRRRGLADAVPSYRAATTLPLR